MPWGIHQQTLQSRLSIIAIAGALIIGMETTVQSQTSEIYQAAREKLVREVLIPGGVRDERVLNSIRSTPRHEFVPASQQDRAYFDLALPIGDKQTISSPYIVSVMTEALEPKPTDKVLEIGTGSGFQAAVLSPLVKDVYTIEIVKPLGERATKVLERLGYKNVHTRIGDGFLGWPEAAPFDKIIVTCSPEKVPQPLVDQLAEGGLMIVPVGERYQQTLYSMRKVDGKLEQVALRPTLFVPMTGEAEDKREAKPDPAHPKIINGDFEQALINAEHVPGWYYQFGLRVERSEHAPAGPQYVEFQNDVPGRPTLLLQGIPLDGRVVRRIRISGYVSTDGVKPASEKEDAPAIVVQFFDEDRKRIALYYAGPFVGNRKWRKESKDLEVPIVAREAIVTIGMFGGVGTARFDGIELEVLKSTPQ